MKPHYPHNLHNVRTKALCIMCSRTERLIRLIFITIGNCHADEMLSGPKSELFEKFTWFPTLSS